MSNKLFSNEEVELLKQNNNVKIVSKKSITYNDSFKLKLINEYTKGSKATTIFTDAGFDLDNIGLRRVKESSSRWLRQFKRDEGLIDTRRNNKGRLTFKGLDENEKMEFLIAQNEYLEKENAFLKKLTAEDRRLEKRQNKYKSTMQIYPHCYFKT